MLKKVCALVSVSLLAGLLSVGAHAANSQQQKMKACNGQATSQKLAGDARKSFMKTCLSANGAATSTPGTPQERMKSCNAQASAKSLKGADRKSFLSTCLKAPPQ